MSTRPTVTDTNSMTTSSSSSAAPQVPAPASARVLAMPSLDCAGLLPRVACPNAVRWKIDSRYYCVKHAEVFWETHYIEEHEVVRLMRDDWQGRAEQGRERASQSQAGQQASQSAGSGLSPRAAGGLALIHAGM